jgi:hypothetical protein
MIAFIHNGDLYIRCVPSKALFRSTMIHEVVNRGDIFALRCKDQCLTIIPGTASVEHVTLPTLSLSSSAAKQGPIPTTNQHSLPL